MLQQFSIAIGAGLAAALLFFIPVKGTAFAMTIALFSALPLMIAGLAFSPASALIGAIAGSLALFLGLIAFADVDTLPALVFSGFFAATAGLPAWQLTRLAWLGRPPQAGETPASDGLVWYPIGRLVGWMVGMSSVVAIAGLLIAVARYGSFEAFLAESVRRIMPVIEAVFAPNSATPGEAFTLPGNVAPEDLARTFIMATPAVMAAWTVASMALNLWLAGRIALVSKSLRRPWLDLPENFDLPRAIAPILAASLALCVLDGLPRAIGASVAASIGAVLAMKGLASVHASTRPLTTRTFLLSALYMVLLVLFPLPLPVFAAMGLSAMFTPRGRTPGAPNTPNSQT